MTITAAPSEQSYAADGVSTVFAIPFPFDTAADLKLTSTDASGNILTLSTGFTISGGAGSTGNATFAPAPAAGLTITIYDNPALTQPTDYVSLDAFPAESHERALDRVTRIAKRLYQLVQRSVRFPDGDVSTDGVLGSVANRKGKYLFFNAITGAIEYAANIVTTTLSQSIIGQLLNPQITAEVAAGVVPTNYFYAPYDIRRYGADSTGAVSSNAALTAAVAVCGTTGGTIRLPAGKYTFASVITALANKTGIILQGDGSATGGAQPATQIAYSGTGTGLFIDFRSSVGCKIRDCQILHTNAGYTGTYMKFGNDGSHGDGPFCELSNCVIGSSVNGVGNVHVDLDKCICFTAYHCNFIYGNPSVLGMGASSYSNVIHFRDCHFYQAYQAPILRQGQAWTIEGCTFEQLTTGAAGAIAGATAGTSPAIGLVVKGCWFGDVTNTAPAGAWIDGCLTGAVIEGNYLTGNSTSNNTTAIVLRQVSGVAILGNDFSVLLNAINFATANCYGVSCRGNAANSVTNIYVNPANVPLGQLDFALGFGMGIPTGHGLLGANGYAVRPDGRIEQWGFVNPASFGNNTVTFPIAFPTACDNVECTMSNRAAGTATIYASTLTTTTFIANITDGVSVTDSFFWRAVGR